MAADARETRLELPWQHDGLERILVVISAQLAPEAHGLLTAFRGLRGMATVDEVRDEAEHIADVHDLRLTLATEPDRAGGRVTIDVQPA